MSLSSKCSNLRTVQDIVILTIGVQTKIGILILIRSGKMENQTVNNQTKTEAEVEKVPGADTSDEGSMVEVILEKKTPQHAP